MKKGFKPSSWIFPQPAIVIATYDKDGRADAMTAAWAGIYDTNKIGIMLDHRHRTMENIKETGAFTVSMSTMETMAESDYFGTVPETPWKTKSAGPASTPQRANT